MEAAYEDPQFAAEEQEEQASVSFAQHLEKLQVRNAVFSSRSLLQLWS